MNSEDLFNAVTELRDDQILAGEERLKRSGNRRRSGRLGALAAVLALAVLAGALLLPRLLGRLRERSPEAESTAALPADPGGASDETGGDPGGEGPAEPQSSPELRRSTLAAAAYPKMAPYAREMDFVDPHTGRMDESAYTAAYRAWVDSRSALRPETDYTAGLDSYLRDAIPVLMEGAGEENRVVSPMNVYMALAMLAESTGGEARSELMTLLNAPDMTTLRARANALWRANYSDDGRMTALLAASVWLRNDRVYNPDTLRILASDYYASVFHGQMGSASYNKAMREWVNTQTRGLLDDRVQALRTDPDTVLALITTVCFQAAWEESFYQSERRSFQAPAGEQDCAFLVETCERELYRGKDFSAASKTLTGGASMYFLLPDEGLSPAELLERRQVLDFLTDRRGRDQVSHASAMVTLGIPKFDVSSQLDLVKKLQTLGVTAVFDEARSDFTPLTGETEEPVVVDQASHGVRVSADETGVTGAAFTEITATGAAEPMELEKVELILDRPFLFVVTNSDGLPFFVGTVNSPGP